MGNGSISVRKLPCSILPPSCQQGSLVGEGLEVAVAFLVGLGDCVKVGEAEAVDEAVGVIVLEGTGVRDGAVENCSIEELTADELQAVQTRTRTAKNQIVFCRFTFTQISIKVCT
jgi:hypothetical protein